MAQPPTIAPTAGSFLVERLELIGDFSIIAAPQLVAEGATRSSLELALPRNALVDRLEVVVTAKPASATVAAEVAQLRVSPGARGAGRELVIDFGTPRTVSIVQVPAGFTIAAVRSWNGMQFGAAVAHHTPLPAIGVLTSEVRTERLQVTLAGAGSSEALLEETLVVLPDAPSDLELRIDDQPPAWRHPGPVRLELGEDLSFGGFNQDGQRLVDLTAAFAALTGEATRSETRTFRLELSSRTAGRLDLAAPAGRRSLRRIWRATADGEPEARLVFTEEGARPVVLVAADRPVGEPVVEVRLTLVGIAPPERVLPPVGPPTSDLAEFVLDPERAAIVRLPGASGLAELHGLRLPLTIAAGGADVQAVLWTSTPEDQPERPLPDGTSEPVALDAGTERWVTLALRAPVPLDPGRPLWAAVVVARGQAVWRPTVAAAAVAGDPSGRLRTGPQAGPWYPLPALFTEAAAAADPDGPPFARVRGRLRLMGRPAPELQVPPVSLAAGSDAVSAAPSAGGTRVTVPASGTAALLTVVAGVAMPLTLRELDLVTAG